MPIERKDYENIINSLDIGNSIAEEDSLLEQARVETPIFTGIIKDDYDVVLGRKGAGKTAIFIIINLLSKFLLKSGLVILSGVNSSGEPIFNLFRKDFEKFSEEEFENFWKLYFISLIYKDFIQAEQFQPALMQYRSHVEKFKDECRKAGIPETVGKQTSEQILAWVMNIFKSKVKKAKFDIRGDMAVGQLILSPELEFFEKKEEKDNKSYYVNNLGNALRDLLRISRFKIWIILDRLDEVFERYSPVEFNGLRGLLRAYKSFDVGKGNGLLRIKIFLRDDILKFLTDQEVYKQFFTRKNLPPLVAATHMLSRVSPTLNWSEDEIEQLILNRLLLNRSIRSYLEIPIPKRIPEIQEELKLKRNRIVYWSKIFPKGITSKWIFTRLKDSNEIVTPRSVIDMLEGAIDYQKKKIQTNYEDCSVIFPAECIKEGLDVASKNKLERDIYNEFPRDQVHIKKLQGGRHKLTRKELRILYGADWEKIVTNLRRIGILKYVKNSNEYRIQFLFRPALDITYKH